MDDPAGDFYSLPVSPHQVAEILARRGSAGNRGSGYLISPSLVLTAEHVVHGADHIDVRVDADQADEWSSAAEVAATAGDVVLLRLASEYTLHPVERPDFGALGDRGAMIRVHAIGFPLFKLRTPGTDSWAPSTYRDSHHLSGWVSVLSNRREGSLELTAAATDLADVGTSPWEGMSGAALWYGQHVIGIVSYHDTREGLSRLTASRLDRLLVTSEAEPLRQALGLAPELPDLLDASRPRIPLWASLAEEFEPPGLVQDREEELAVVAGFCAGDDYYLALTGDPWSGKTALMATVAMNAPPGCDVISFFLTRRIPGQATGSAFTDSLIEQLSAYLEVQPPIPTETGRRDDQRRTLLQRAAARALAEGRTLLLVVDGLDEDGFGETTGALHSASVASLLPRQRIRGLKVLVSSREHGALSRDVPADHPVRTCPAVRLTPSSRALGQRESAILELDEIFLASTVGRDIVGLLSAARGGLSLGDLAELLVQPVFAVDQVLSGSLRRSVSSIRSASGAADTFVFAHVTLQEIASERLGPDYMRRYEQQLVDWIAGYGAQRWPAGSPQFAVYGFFDLLVRRGVVPSVVATATDAFRHAFLRSAVGDDWQATTEVDLAARLLTGTDSQTVAAAIALAVHRERLDHVPTWAPSELPALWHRLGASEHAWRRLHTITDAADRDAALGHLALSLAEASQVAQAERLIGSISSESKRRGAIVQLADVYARQGRADDLERLIRSTTDLVAQLATLSQLFEVIGPTAHASDFENLAARLITPGHRSEWLAMAAGVLAKNGRYPEARRLIGSGLSHEQRWDAEVALARRYLGAGEIEAAATLIAGLGERESGETIPARRERQLADLVPLLAMIDQEDLAQRRLSEIESPVHRADALGSLAVVLVGRHETEAALALLDGSLPASYEARIRMDLIEALRDEDLPACGPIARVVIAWLDSRPDRCEVFALELAGVLARAGMGDEVELLLRSPAVIDRLMVCSRAARAAYRAGHRREALQYLGRLTRLESKVTTSLEMARQALGMGAPQDAALFAQLAEEAAEQAQQVTLRCSTLAAGGSLHARWGDLAGARRNAIACERLSRPGSVSALLRGLPGLVAPEIVRWDPPLALELIALVPASDRAQTIAALARGLVRASSAAARDVDPHALLDSLPPTLPIAAACGALAAVWELAEAAGDATGRQAGRISLEARLGLASGPAEILTAWLAVARASPTMATDLLTPDLAGVMRTLAPGPLRTQLLIVLSRLDLLGRAFAPDLIAIDKLSMAELLAILSGAGRQAIPGRDLAAELGARIDRGVDPATVLEIIDVAIGMKDAELAAMALAQSASGPTPDQCIDLAALAMSGSLASTPWDVEFLQRHSELDAGLFWIEVSCWLADHAFEAAAVRALELAGPELGQGLGGAAAFGHRIARRAAVLARLGRLREAQQLTSFAMGTVPDLEEGSARALAASLMAAQLSLGDWNECEKALAAAPPGLRIEVLDEALATIRAIAPPAGDEHSVSYAHIIIEALREVRLSRALPLVFAQPADALVSLGRGLVAISDAVAESGARS